MLERNPLFHSVIFKDQGEGVVIVQTLNIWYLCKALNLIFTGHTDLKNDKFAKI